MGKRKPVLIGRFAFETQTEAREFVREILNTTTWGKPLEGETHEFVFSLLDRHPRAAEKIGCGVSHFVVDSDGNGDRCLYVHRADRSRHHFSYQKSLTGKDDIRSLIVGALNRAVDELIWAFRDSELARGVQFCHYTGEPISKDHYHVDHHNPTFLELYTAWLAQTGLQLVDVRLSDGSDNEIGRQMADPAQRESWQQFHRDHARLRLLSPLGNLSGAKIEANRRIRATTSVSGQVRAVR